MTRPHELPPLPEQHRVFACLCAFKQRAFSYEGVRTEIEAFAQEYARQAVLVERERCAQICDDHAENHGEYYGAAAVQAAAAIRKGLA